MSRSIFGWSYPPGCSGPPDGPDFCEVCGNGIDDCVCPECPVCESVGDPNCYVGALKHNGHRMIMTEEQCAAKAAANKRQKEEEERWAREEAAMIEEENKAEESWQEYLEDMKECEKQCVEVDDE